VSPCRTVIYEIRACLKLALFRHAAMSGLSPLSGAKRKLDFGTARSAFDPKRTSHLKLAALRIICEQRHRRVFALLRSMG
jgi:hypothetical protein